MTLLHPLLNRRTVLSVTVLLNPTLPAAMVRPLCSPLPICLLIVETMDPVGVPDYRKLKCRWPGVLLELCRAVRGLSLLCSVPRITRAVARE